MIKTKAEALTFFAQNAFEVQDLNKIADSLDYFMALILQDMGDDVDIITLQTFITAVKTNYYFGYWKRNEFDLYMLAAFKMMYEIVDPIKDGWPKISEKYKDLTTTINMTLNSDGNTNQCQDEPTVKNIKEYIVAILNQSATVTENTVTTEQMNRNMVDDFKKMLAMPSKMKVINQAVLSLQPYVYDDDSCGDCGGCGKCRKQKFDTNKPYFVTLMKRLDELCHRMSYYERTKTGPRGPEGPQGPEGETGPKGEDGRDGLNFDLEVVFPLRLSGSGLVNVISTQEDFDIEIISSDEDVDVSKTTANNVMTFDINLNPSGKRLITGANFPLDLELDESEQNG